MNVLAEVTAAFIADAVSFHDVFPLEDGFHFSFQLPTPTFPYALPGN